MSFGHSFSEFYCIVTARAIEICELRRRQFSLAELPTPYLTYLDGSLVFRGREITEQIDAILRFLNLKLHVEWTYHRSLALFGPLNFYSYLYPRDYSGSFPKNTRTYFGPGNATSISPHSAEYANPVTAVIHFAKPINPELRKHLLSYLAYWQSTVANKDGERCEIVRREVWVAHDLAWFSIACQGNRQDDLNWLSIVCMELGARHTPVFQVTYNPGLDGPNGYGERLQQYRDVAECYTLPE
jgi:hypothetical protein